MNKKVSVSWTSIRWLIKVIKSDEPREKKLLRVQAILVHMKIEKEHQELILKEVR